MVVLDLILAKKRDTSRCGCWMALSMSAYCSLQYESFLTTKVAQLCHQHNGCWVLLQFVFVVCPLTDAVLSLIRNNSEPRRISEDHKSILFIRAVIRKELT